MKTTYNERTLNRAMTVADLMQELESLPPDAKVVFTCDYGDICHTQQALPVTEVRELDPSCESIADSGYSRSGLELAGGDDPHPEEDAEDPGEWDGPPVVILSF
jgi:hypothetical protein